MGSFYHTRYRKYDWDHNTLRSCGEIEPADDLSRLVGVSEDKEDGTVIVTFLHVIARYRLSREDPFNVKLGAWTTNFRLTSEVVYDRTLNRYIGVFHDNTLRLWSDGTSNLEKTEKYIFRLPILRVLTRQQNEPIIIFRNGDCITLSHGLQHCGTFSRRALVKKSAVIIDVAPYTRAGTDHICYIVKDNGSDNYITTLSIKDGVCDSRKISSVKVLRSSEKKEVNVNGIKIVVASGEDPVVHVTWTDSGISTYNIARQFWKHNMYNHGFNFYDKEVTMACIGKNYFFMYMKPKESGYAVMSVQHSHMRADRNEYWHIPRRKHIETKLCKTGDFIVLAALDKIFVWDVKYSVYPRAPHWRCDDMIPELVKELRKPEECLPVMGYTELSLWNWSSVYRSVK